MKAGPTCSLHSGSCLEGRFRTQRVTHKEGRAALRANGEAGAEGVAAVVLGTDATLTVVSGTCVGAGALDCRGVPAA